MDTLQLSFPSISTLQLILLKYIIEIHGIEIDNVFSYFPSRKIESSKYKTESQFYEANLKNMEKEIEKIHSF